MEMAIDEIIEHCNRTCEMAEMVANERGQTQDDITSKRYWEHYHVAKYLEELKRMKDAEEQGLLKILPCRVGDTVFLVQYGKMYERKVNGFSVTSNNQLVIHIPDFEMDNASFPEHTFGKFVFFDRKKAESALAEKGGVE